MNHNYFLRGWFLLPLGSGVLAAVSYPLPVTAQIGQLTGSTSGSYCKVKKNDKIEVDTWLPLNQDIGFARRMTLRRLASVARSKGFSAIAVAKESVCGDLLINGTPRNRRCVFRASMTNSVGPVDVADLGGETMSVDRIIAETEVEKDMYPVRTGLLNHGNKCVID